MEQKSFTTTTPAHTPGSNRHKCMEQKVVNGSTQQSQERSNRHKCMEQKHVVQPGEEDLAAKQSAQVHGAEAGLLPDCRIPYMKQSAQVHGAEGDTADADIMHFPEALITSA